MKTLCRYGLLALAAALLPLMAACGPSYPECHDDENCAEKSEYCLNAKCAQCRDDSHCLAALDESYVCESGACQRIVGYCSPPNFTCPVGQKCRDNRCGPECLDNTECADNQECKNGRCVDKPDCVADDDCPTGQICQNGSCIAPPECQPRVVYFDFDESAVRSDQTDTIDSNAACFNERENVSGIQLTGHADERGTEEYNMVLSERRAKAVRKVMGRSGVSKSKLKTKGRGEYDPAVPNARSESDHSRNRRVDFDFN